MGRKCRRDEGEEKISNGEMAGNRLVELDVLASWSLITYLLLAVREMERE